MKAQFKYAIRLGLEQRAVVFSAVLLVNLVLVFLDNVIVNGKMHVTAVSISSLALSAVFIVNIIADVESLKTIFKSPNGYLSALTPVKSGKILFAHLTSIICADFIALFAGLCGVLYHTFMLTGFIRLGATSLTGVVGLSEVLFGLCIFFLGYAYILSLIVFGLTLVNSLLSRMPAKFLAGLVCTAAAIFVFNLLNFSLLPFGTVQNWGIFFNITLRGGINAGSVMYVMITLIKSTILFFVSSSLLDRRVNLS